VQCGRRQGATAIEAVWRRPLRRGTIRIIGHGDSPVTPGAETGIGTARCVRLCECTCARARTMRKGERGDHSRTVHIFLQLFRCQGRGNGGVLCGTHSPRRINNGGAPIATRQHMNAMVVQLLRG